MTIIGVSFDTVVKNAAFKKSDNFQFELWSDLGRELALYYGAATTKTQGAADRITVILDPEARAVVQYGSFLVNTTLSAHPQNGLDDCKALQGL